jgi:XTP/dITP diphosphohydrolase
VKTPPGKILFATSNEGKAREMRAMLALVGVEVMTLRDLPGVKMPPEESATFEGNATQKARFVAALIGLPALADDSGLEVDALGGRPGVRSARYAGNHSTDRDNYLKLLEELRGVPEPDRTARFVCALAYVEPGGLERTFEGFMEGVITLKPSGTAGFGYDPVFFVPSLGRTAAELTGDEKNAVSHRGAAFRAFRRWFMERP